MTLSRGDYDSDRVLAQLRTLQHVPSGSFSSHAVETLADRQADYLADVSQEATKIAKRNQSDVVSAIDVEEADRKLHRAASSRGGLTETLGAAVFGVGLSDFVAVMTSSHPGHLRIAAGCGGMVLGLIWTAFRRQRRN